MVLWEDLQRARHRGKCGRSGAEPLARGDGVEIDKEETETEDDMGARMRYGAWLRGKEGEESWS